MARALILAPRRRSTLSSSPRSTGPVGANAATSSRSKTPAASLADQRTRFEQTMAALKIRVASHSQSTQRAGNGVVGRGEQRSAEQGLRAPPAGSSKKRGKGSQHSLHLGGWRKH